MSRIFLDADIMLDVLAQRKPFYEPAANLLTLIETGQVSGCTSSLVFSNLYYVLRKLRGRGIALTSLRKLQNFIDILAVGERSIQFALNSAFNDFEDAIQYHTAIQHHVRYLITRNLKDYKATDRSIVTICTARDYLKLRDASQYSVNLSATTQEQ
ncbi:VapC toxin family PIN domain ribonuclease [candidate division KSB3 bacterium]|uniref:VapC toxin family PIN domain ribonuclease n=1 Tax=candidate division KSB3 bacterium TaxID=2044937 RepID=A0A2G6KKW1_9BACT|nr:MAG: VapC toxin family PIN domain ribonuclease [candidate division KSB3 bacterium]